MSDQQEMPLPYETPQAPSGPTGASVPGSSGGQPEINLDELPQFRQWKSNMDKQVAQERNARLSVEQRLSAIEAENNRIKMASMDEPERLAFERDQAFQQAMSYRNELARLTYEQRVKQDNEDMAVRLGISVKELEQNAGFDNFNDDPHVRWTKALDYVARKGQTQRPAQPQQGQPWQQVPPQQPWQQVPPQQPQPWQQPYQQGYAPPQAAPAPWAGYPPQPPQQFTSPASNPANWVDTGSGTSAGTLDRFSSAYRQARENNDMGAMLDIEAAARQAGVAVQK